jgi:hypothetical protein
MRVPAKNDECCVVGTLREKERNKHVAALGIRSSGTSCPSAHGTTAALLPPTRPSVGGSVGARLGRAPLDASEVEDCQSAAAAKEYLLNNKFPVTNQRVR